VLAPSLGGQTDMQKVESSKEPAALFVSEIERLLGSAQFFGGANVSLADLHALPVVTYLAATPEGKAILEGAPNLRGWLSRMQKRPSAQAMMPS
jgi:glutathione S-transferase